jgi:beta-glucosidase
LNEPSSLPPGLRDRLIDFKRRQAVLPPTCSPEDGMASDDAVVFVSSSRGAVAGPRRIRFLERRRMALNEAIAAGVDVRGQSTWPPMDDCGWSFGCEHRFGITHVGHVTQVRTLEHSALALRAFLMASRER